MAMGGVQSENSGGGGVIAFNLGGMKELKHVHKLQKLSQSPSELPPKSSTSTLIQDAFQLSDWFGDGLTNKENVHQEIARRFSTFRQQLSEKEYQLQKQNMDCNLLQRRNLLLESELREKKKEIQDLRTELERERWGYCYEGGVNVSKMRQAVKDLHGTFGAMIDSLRSTNNSLGLGRPGQHQHTDVEELQSEVDHLFNQVQFKLRRWENNQLEMQMELGQTKQVLENFMGQLLMAREAAIKAKQDSNQFNPPTGKVEPLNLHTPDPVSPPPQPPHPNPAATVRKSVITVKPTVKAKPKPPVLVVDLEQEEELLAMRDAVTKEKDNTITFHYPAPVEDRERVIISPPQVKESTQSSDTGESTISSTMPNLNVFICSSCGEGFSTLVQLRLHSKLAHKVPTTAAIVNSILSPTEEDDAFIPSPPAPKKRRHSAEVGDRTIH